MRQKKNSVTVSGKVILSTIETMESLGRIGEDLLRSHGITKIEEDFSIKFKLKELNNLNNVGNLIKIIDEKI